MKTIFIFFICLTACMLRAQNTRSNLRPIRLSNSRKYTRFYINDTLVPYKSVVPYLNLFPNSANELRRSEACGKSSAWNAAIFTLSSLTARLTYKPWFKNPGLHRLDEALLVTASSSMMAWLISSTLDRAHLRKAVNLYNRNILIGQIIAGS